MVKNKELNEKLIRLDKQFFDKYDKLDNEEKEYVEFYSMILRDYNESNDIYDLFYEDFKSIKNFNGSEMIEYISNEYGAKDFFLYIYNMNNVSIDNNVAHYLNKSLDYLDLTLNGKSVLLKLEKEGNDNLYNVIIENLINDMGKIDDLNSNKTIGIYNIFAENNNLPSLTAFVRADLDVAQNSNGDVKAIVDFFKETIDGIFVGKEIVFDMLEDINKDFFEQKYKEIPFNIVYSVYSSISKIKENEYVDDYDEINSKIQKLKELRDNAYDWVIETVLSKIDHKERINIFNQIMVNSSNPNSECSIEDCKNIINSKPALTNNKIDNIDELFSSKNMIEFIVKNQDKVNKNVINALVNTVNHFYNTRVYDKKIINKKYKFKN